MIRTVMHRHRNPRLGVALRALAFREEGATAVEFAIVAPVLMTLLFGIMDFGRALWTYNIAVSALREAGRVAAVAGLTNTTATTCAGVAAISTAAVSRATAYLDGTLGAGAPKGTPTASCVNGVITVGYVGNSFPFTPIAPLVSKLTGTTLTVRPAIFRWEKES
jgi:Flp pilus assembly protein TadG